MTPDTALVDAADPPAPGVRPQAAALPALAALAALPVGVSVFDDQDRLLLGNERFARLWRLPPALLARGTPHDAIVAAAQAQEVVSPDPPPLDDMPGTTRHEWRLPDGRAIETTRRPQPGGGWIGVHEDVSARRQDQKRLAHLARHDPLTGLPNRMLLREVLQRELHPDGPEVAVLCLDLDHFKQVNDTLGHPAGDLLLQQVAERLRGGARQQDTVVRLGGDEFALVQRGAAQPAGATAVGRRLIEALRAPFELDGQRVHVGTSIGVAVGPWDGADPDTLLKNADLALYRAKDDGRGTLRFFEPSMDVRMRQRRQLESDLRGALARGEFELEYQVQVALDDATRITGFEALLRWNHPLRGRLEPAQFLALAEETGLIVPIGQWVLRRACADAAGWPGTPGVSVNVSPVQFRGRTIGADVMAALREAGLAPGRLELEIEESVLVRDSAAVLSMMHGLREQGVRISIDGFGTGVSSLAYLRQFPFDRIKVDRSFARELATSDDAAAIVRAIVGLGGSLGIATLVEGIETEAQLQALRRGVDGGSGRCQAAQGFFFGRPATAACVQAMLVAAPAGAASPALTTAPEGSPHPARSADRRAA